MRLSDKKLHPLYMISAPAVSRGDILNSAAMDGKYQEAYPIFEKQGGINQAILLLSMKQNSKAWEVLKKVEDTSPDTEYVKAIAANRLNNVNEAVIHLRNAITQKPSLKEIAQKDGDVLDLLDLLDLDKK